MPLARAPGFDQTLRFMRDPYRFISVTCEQLGSDVFRARLLLRPVICMRGREAAGLFYGSPHLIRNGAALPRIQRTLTGRQSIQSLDDGEHRHRKALFLSILSPPRVAALTARVADDWRRWTGDRLRGTPVGFYHEAKLLLMRAVCDWSGIPLEEHDLESRTRSVAALYEYAGSVGPRHWWARWMRTRSERWAEDLISSVRRGSLRPEPESAVARIALHHGLDGALLPPRIAAVELLNIVRPTVAVAVYLTHALHALHLYPAERAAIAAHPGDSRRIHRFVQEVRRWYPFFPAAMARVGTEFVWQEHRFPAGRRVMLDLYGTNRDARTWADPDIFRPDRFIERDSDDGCSLVPQGGGDAATSHRCPGEPLAISLMQATVVHFATSDVWCVPPQDLRLDYGHLPALPFSHLLLSRTAP
jgi:fatty-acid peroxygenase